MKTIALAFLTLTVKDFTRADDNISEHESTYLAGWPDLRSDLNETESNGR